MLELGSSGSVRGVSSNGHPYRDPRPFFDNMRLHVAAYPGNSMGEWRVDLQPCLTNSSCDNPCLRVSSPMLLIMSVSPFFARRADACCAG